MADPLTLLREFTKNKKPVVLENDTFIFDDIKFPRSTKTNFRSRKGEGEPYTLDAVWFILQRAEQKFTDYLVDCRKLNFPNVSLVDKKDLISYLTGETDSCASIVVVPKIPGLGEPFREKDRERGSERDTKEERSAKRQKTELEDVELDEALQAEKDEIAKRLQAPKVKQTIPNSIPSVDLGSGLTNEKINEIKLKRALVKRTTIRDDEEKSAPSKSKFVEADVAITKDIIDRERVIRTRTSILQSNKKHFTSIINSVNQQHKKEEQQKHAEKKQVVSYDRYQEVQEDKFWKEKLKGNVPEDFQIDTRGGFADIGRMPDRNDISQLAKSKPKQSAKPNPPSKSPSKPMPDRNVIPIIIVPSALTSLITTYNCKDFLIDGTFVTSIDKKNSGMKKDSAVILERKKSNTTHTLKYQIIDNTTKITPKDWERVVAVFTSGAAWQFKQWIWNNPVELFSRVRGFYLTYEDEKIPDTVKSWDVKILSVSKVQTKKHLAQTAALEFWTTLDNFIRSKKSDVFNHIYYPENWECEELRNK